MFISRVQGEVSALDDVTIRHTHLVAALSVARPEPHGFVHVLRLDSGVHALSAPRVANLRRGRVTQWTRKSAGHPCC